MLAQPLHVVIAIPNIWLCETLFQMLSDTDVEVECVQTLDECLGAVERSAAAVIVDVFGFPRPYGELLDALTGVAPATHIIALLSTDSIDYQEAVLRRGASAALLQERVGEELIPLIEHMLRIDIHR